MALERESGSREFIWAQENSKPQEMVNLSIAVEVNDGMTVQKAFELL